MNNIEIICGNALEKLQGFPDQHFDLIVADPPYNLGKRFGNNNDSRTFEEYLAFSRSWLAEAKRVLKFTGTIYVFMGFQFISYLYNLLGKDLRLHFNSWICWHYTQGIGRKRGFSPRHDDILMFTRSEEYKFNLDAVRVPQKYYRKRNNMRGANPGDVWEFSHVHYCNENRFDHPTQKPEGLIERMVLASSEEEDLVIDPFAGSGTTLRVCQQLNRRCVGIELNPEYVDMIRGRLSLPLSGFDSIDPRMKRIPNDLLDPEIRSQYLTNHIRWFLDHHSNAIPEFEKAVDDKYGKHQKRVDQTEIDF